ncbi:hypothetical protein CKAH01_10735 [Colletotrichum kahawae]|uniref:Uncharacterized protein n=1 Tax=Colletotrichum kahawae TaxID=34407 RepID=A0AAD9XWV2_COLKA|nr:hypothetical protein CKAH01_10735 [Colletotrichum kahawae]
MRCRKEAEHTSTDDPEDVGMTRIGYNLFYCVQCVNETGYQEAGCRSCTYVVWGL